MPEVAVVGSFKIDPGKEDERSKAFKALVEPTHREDGCILYALHRGTDDPARLDVHRALGVARATRRPPRERLTWRHCSSAPTSCGATTARSRCTRRSRRGEPKKGSLAEHAGG